MKIFRSFSALILALFLFVPASVGAYDQVYDSGCTANTSGWISAHREGGLIHFFEPKLDHLTKFQAVVYVAEPGNFTLKFQKLGTSSPIITKSVTSTSTGTKYLMFDDFDIEYGGAGLKKYYLQLEMTSGNVGWHYTSNTTCDAKGYAYWGGSQQNADMWANIWGYNNSEPEEQVDDGGDGTDGSNVVKTPTVEQKASVKGEIAAPVLKELLKGGEKIEIPDDAKVSVNAGDKLTLSGGAPKEAIVRAIFNANDILASVEPNGDWTWELDTAGLADGEYTVTMLAEKDGKQSKQVTVLTVTVAGATTESLVTEPEGPDYLVYGMAVGVVLLIALIALAVYLFMKRKKGKALPKSEPPKDTAPPVEPPVK